MARLTQISPEAASGRAGELLDAVKRKLGLVPNMTRAMANSPAALDGYLRVDDVSLESHLRHSANPWARRIVERRPYVRVAERHGSPGEVDFEAEKSRLFDAGIGHIHTASTGKLSRYDQVGKKRKRDA